jgi:F-type H+-transporting ATPase subunit b
MNLNLTLIAQAVTFTAFIWVTVKWIWPHMLRAIEARQKTVADGLAAAEQGRRSLDSATREAEVAIAQARGRAAEILAQADRRAAQLVDEARNAAKEEGNREKAAAKAEIAQAITRAREQLRDQVASLAVSGAEKILRREVDARAHSELLESIKRQL